jgi:AraC-like DNA-binding protein
VCSPNTDCLGFDPRSTHFAVLTVPENSPVAAAGSALMANATESVAALLGTHGRQLRESLVRLRDAIALDSRTVFTQPDAQFETTLCRSLRQAVTRHCDGRVTDFRSRTVRRAEAFVRKHISEGISIAQLSTVAGVSERSLRNAFYDVYTTSPKRYFTLWQLHQVRRALLTTGGGAATVTNAATCHGFFELGRFAAAYRSLFGETPSETLHKGRLRGAVGDAA